MMLPRTLARAATRNVRLTTTSRFKAFTSSFLRRCLATNAHVKTGETDIKYQTSIHWDEDVRGDLETWLDQQPLDDIKSHFETNGYAVVQDLLSPEEVASYDAVYTSFLHGDIDASAHRHDLGSHTSRVDNSVENICQIMWPSDYVENLVQGPLHVRAEAVAKHLLGDDMAFDFDMLISKNPRTMTETPWHQDQAYWLDMPDKRAVSFWVAIDEATVDNGCMWFGPGTHLEPLRKHRPARDGHHVLTCDFDDSQGKPVPLKPGSCTLHHGATVHHSKGNSTSRTRRAYIVNFRPKEMVEYSRSKGFDHGRKGVEDFDYSVAGDVYKGRDVKAHK